MFLLWCFNGEVVVERVANVVTKMALIRNRKTCHILQIYFRVLFREFWLSLLRVADALVDD